MIVIDDIINHAEQHCSEQGSRLTNKRKLVLSCLLKSNGALSAYELADACKSELGKSIPPMSIYRILRFLIEENLVHKLELANKFIACEHISCDHSHGLPQFLICRECSKVKEVSINNSTIDDLKISAQNAGFQLHSPKLELSGLCEDCNNN